MDRWTGKQKTVKVKGMQVQKQAGENQLGTMTLKLQKGTGERSKGPFQ